MYKESSKKNQLGDRRSDLRGVGEIQNDIAKQAHDSVGNIAYSQNMGAGESRR